MTSAASCYYASNTTSTAADYASCQCKTTPLVTASSGSIIPGTSNSLAQTIGFNAYYGAPNGWRGGSTSTWTNASSTTLGASAYISFLVSACGETYSRVSVSVPCTTTGIPTDSAPGIAKMFLVWWPAYQFYDASSNVISVPAGAATCLEGGTVTLPPLPLGSAISTTGICTSCTSISS